MPQEQNISACRPTVSSETPQLQASTRSVQLLQANADRVALSLNWSAFPTNGEETPDYRIEAAIEGSEFTDWVEIGSSGKLSIDFTNEEFNRQIRKLFVTGFSEDVMLRVKYNRGKSAALYTFATSLQVTTYQPVIDYDDSHVFRIPGNFENWKIDSAQKIISPKLDGQYEGYINFSDAHSQFLMVKTDASWRTLTTYYYIGADKFGFGGNMFCVSGGAGIYKFNASTDTHLWSCTKINSFSVNGTAVTADGNTDVDLVFNPSNNTWEITGSFSKGNFVFRANKNNTIVLGHNTGSGPGVPDYNGAKIEITKAGNYTISLSLQKAGNYSYGIQRNV
ncbi:MAG: SusE domain-containing protein [Bacteroidota bacterium]